MLVKAGEALRRWRSGEEDVQSSRSGALSLEHVMKGMAGGWSIILKGNE